MNYMCVCIYIRMYVPRQLTIPTCFPPLQYGEQFCINCSVQLHQ